MRSVILLPPAPGNVAISAKLIAHLSRHYPTQEHHPFHLEHRLFSDTSSQLPGSDVKQRCYTHVLNLSHHPHHAFVSSTKAGNANESSTITIPASSAEPFAGLISTKLQPAWYPRQMLSLEKGVCVSIDEKSLIVCVGDARASARSQGAGALRGTIVELFRREDITSDASAAPDDAAEDEAWMQSALEDLFKGTGVSFNAKVITSRTRPRRPVEGAETKDEPDWSLAKLYMAVFTR